MIQRLRLKFICVNMAVVLLMLGLIFGLVLHANSRSAERESLRMMQAAAAAQHRGGLPHPPPPGGDTAHMPFFILQPDGNGKIRAEGGASFDLSDEALLGTLYEQAAAEKEPVGVLSAYRLRYLRAETPEGLRIVFADISGEQAAQRRLLQSCLLIGSCSIAVFLLISIALSYWAVKPVDTAWKQQRQFVSDASHELKTPLTVILTNAELLQDAAAPPDSRAQFAENILVMSREMRALIEKLLELARAEDGLPRQAAGTVNLSRLVSRAMLPFEPIYFEKGLRLSGDIAEHIAVHGIKGQLQHVIEILLDNAQKYAAPGGEITVALKKSGVRHCLLTVTNPGEPLTPAQRRDIFKRFYRTDQARSRDGSYGLGLSIAEAVVRQHRGRIWADSGASHNTFSVLLPTKNAAP